MATDPKVVREVFIRDGWKCRHCSFRNGIQPHHIIYQSHGGKDTTENIITLCWKCHSGHHDNFLTITVLDDKLGANGKVKFIRKGNWKP